jgi:hypothetical protein
MTHIKDGARVIEAAQPDSPGPANLPPRPADPPQPNIPPGPPIPGDPPPMPPPPIITPPAEPPGPVA